MVKTLYLIRHGETEGAEVRRYKGSTDVPLSKNGIRQMRRIAAFIQTVIQDTGYRIHPTLSPLNKGGIKGGYHASCIMHRASSILSAVYTSDLSRAIKSAEIIAKPFGIEPAVVPELRERNFGIWEGMSFNEIKGIYPEEFEAWAENPLKFSPMGGESTLEVKDRVINSLNQIIGRHEKENIVIVSHGGVNRIILCYLLGIPLENIFRIEQDYGALNIIEFWDKYPVVKLLNGIIDG